MSDLGLKIKMLNESIALFISLDNKVDKSILKDIVRINGFTKNGKLKHILIVTQ